MSEGVVIGGSANVTTKRGPEGQNWIRFTWLFLIGLSYFLLNKIPIDHLYVSIILYVVHISIITWLCFRNAEFQEWIFRLKLRLEDWIPISGPKSGKKWKTIVVILVYLLTMVIILFLIYQSSASSITHKAIQNNITEKNISIFNGSYFYVAKDFVNTNSDLITIIYTIFGLAFSIFYGCKAIDIFVDKSVDGKLYHQKKDLWSWKFHQFWINFIGSCIGWFALAYIIFVRCCKYDLVDVSIFIIAIVGITGFLPYIISKISVLK